MASIPDVRLSVGAYMLQLTAVVAGEDFVNEVFSTEALAPSCTKKCHVSLPDSSGGKGGSTMAFVEDKFIVKAS